MLSFSRDASKGRIIKYIIDHCHCHYMWLQPLPRSSSASSLSDISSMNYFHLLFCDSIVGKFLTAVSLFIVNMLIQCTMIGFLHNSTACQHWFLVVGVVFLNCMTLLHSREYAKSSIIHLKFSIVLHNILFLIPHHLMCQSQERQDLQNNQKLKSLKLSSMSFSEKKVKKICF